MTRASTTAPLPARGLKGPDESLLQRAQALAARLPHLGMGPDLSGLALADLWGAYRFLARVSDGGTNG